MADLKISALNSLAGADLVAADVVAVVDDSASETKKLTVSDLIANGVTLISDSTIPSAKILFSAGSVDTAELAASAVETAKINDSAVTAAKLADNSSVTLVSTLPASGDFTGQIALDTDDDKIYIWDGSAWDSVKGAGSINVVNGSTSGIVNITTSTSGDTVTVSTTLDDTSAAAQFLAGPTGAGGTVGYRAIIGTDLPTATTSAKGGVIVNGNGLVMSGDTLTIDNSVTAEATENHLVQYDANGLITSGRAIVAGDVPVATSSATGAVKPGSGLEVTAAGAINHSNSVSGATAAKVTFDAQGHITASEALAASDVPDLDASKITTGTLPTARLANDAVTADKLGDKSTTTIAETTPAGGSFIGQGHLNSISGDFLIWDGNVWQPIGVSVGEIVLAGTYDASTNLMATVTSEGTSLSYVVGSALPAASASNKGYYVVVSEAGTGTSPAPTVALNPPDFLLSTGTAYTEIDVSSTVVAQVAENISFTAAGNIAATNVQAAIEELDSEKVGSASPTFTGTVGIGTAATIQFEGASANDFETTLTVTDPTADRTITLPDVTGTVVTTGDTGSVTSTMILDGTIANADISSSAEIAVSKLANGTARQLLQTDTAGTGVEFTSNVDVPGTLDVTGAATLDSTLDVTGVISADGKVKFPAGTASAPSFYSGTDTNTGLYFSAADEVSITTGGTQRVAVDSSGRALIGLSSARSNFYNIAASAALQIEGVGGTGDGRRMSVISSEATTSGGGLVLSHQRSGAVGGNTILQNNDAAGVVSFQGSDGAQFVEMASIEALVDGTPGSDDMPGRLVFSTTADGATSPSERLRIDSSGDVAIGTTSPSFKLSVAGGGISTQTSANDGALVFLPLGGSNENRIYSRSSVTGTGSKDLAFRIGDTERLRIDSSGNVGIGTTSPAEILHLSKTGASDEPTLKISSENGDIFLRTAGSSGSFPSGGSGNDGELLYLGGDFRVGIGTASKNLIFMNGSSYQERARIDSSGNIGINQTSVNSSRKVEITQPSSYTSALRVISGSSSGDPGFIEFFTGPANYRIGGNYPTDALKVLRNTSELMRIDSSGRLLLGTSSSQSVGFEHSFQIEGTAGTDSSASLIRNSNDASGPHIDFAKTRGTANGSNTVVQSGDDLGNLIFRGADGTDKASIAVQIQAEVDGTPGSNDMPGRLLFMTTADGSSTATEAMRIDSKQRVTVKAGAIAEIDTLTSASTVTPDFATSCNFTLTLGTNVTLANPSNLTAGQSGSIFLVQDGTGSRTITFGSYWDFAGGTAPTLSTAASSVDRLDYIVRTSTSIHAVVTLAYS